MNARQLASIKAANTLFLKSDFLAAYKAFQKIVSELVKAATTNNDKRLEQQFLYCEYKSYIALLKSNVLSLDHVINALSTLEPHLILLLENRQMAADVRTILNNIKQIREDALDPIKLAHSQWKFGIYIYQIVLGKKAHPFPTLNSETDISKLSIALTNLERAQKAFEDSKDANMQAVHELYLQVHIKWGQEFLAAYHVAKKNLEKDALLKMLEDGKDKYVDLLHGLRQRAQMTPVELRFTLADILKELIALESPNAKRYDALLTFMLNEIEAQLKPMPQSKAEISTPEVTQQSPASDSQKSSFTLHPKKRALHDWMSAKNPRTQSDTPDALSKRTKPGLSL